MAIYFDAGVNFTSTLFLPIANGSLGIEAVKFLTKRMPCRFAQNISLLFTKIRVTFSTSKAV